VFTHFVTIGLNELGFGTVKGRAMLEQIRVVDKERIQKNIGQINQRGMSKLHNAMLVATGFEKTYTTNEIIS